MANRIRVKWTLTGVILETVIDDEPLAWISFNAAEIDGLVHLLAEARQAMIAAQLAEGHKAQLADEFSAKPKRKARRKKSSTG